MRRKIAEANNIPLRDRECTHTGDCAGTCPYCESEVRYLERELSKRRALGKAVGDSELFADCVCQLFVNVGVPRNGRFHFCFCVDVNIVFFAVV